MDKVDYTYYEYSLPHLGEKITLEGIEWEIIGIDIQITKAPDWVSKHSNTNEEYIYTLYNGKIIIKVNFNSFEH